MNEPSVFDSICKAMESPEFYPHPVAGEVERIETHISVVFRTGDWVYKLKKPVSMGFLDFRSLEKRRECCEAEVTLNQRFSRGIYESVVEIRRDEGNGFRIGGNGDVVECAVKMKQLPDEDNLRSMLPAGKVQPGDAEELGSTLARFYESTERSPEIDRYGRPDAIRYNVRENFDQTEPYTGEILDPERWRFLKEISLDFIDRHAGFFQNRVEKGRIRDGHGDLRSDHVYFHDGVQIIDCVEFNDRFRYGDVTVDLAYLHMDMEHLGHRDFARRLLGAYVKASGDPEIYTLLEFYACYRAMVQTKLRCFRASQVENPKERETFVNSARSYLDQAYYYALQFARPILWVFSGLPASGKSTLAEALARALSYPRFTSDRVRREMLNLAAGGENVTAYGEGIYRKGMRDQVYSRMLGLAHDKLRNGYSVVLDATFSTRKWREESGRLAEDEDVSIVFVECTASGETLRERLKAREREAGESDARLQHFQKMVENFDPFTEVTPETYVKLDTTGAFEGNFAELLAEGFERHWKQVATLR